MEPEDVEQEAWVILLEIKPKWDSERGTWTKFASNTIRLRLLDKVRDQWLVARGGKGRHRAEAVVRATVSLEDARWVPGLTSDDLERQIEARRELDKARRAGLTPGMAKALIDWPGKGKPQRVLNQLRARMAYAG